MESLETKTSEAEIDDKREAAISKFLDKYAADFITRFIQDQWFLSHQPPEKYLAELDLSSQRSKLIGHLTEKFIITAKEDPILMGVYRDTAMERTRMRVIRSIYTLGMTAENGFNELVNNLYNTPADELAEFEHWVASNPAAYADIYSGFAQISHGVSDTSRR